MNTLVHTSKIYNSHLVAKCLLNRAPTHANITVAREARDFIQQELDYLSVFDTVICDRVSYSYAVAMGESVVEYENRMRRDGKATKEMVKLYEEITSLSFPLDKVQTLKSLEVDHG